MSALRSLERRWDRVNNAIEKASQRAEKVRRCVSRGEILNCETILAGPLAKSWNVKKLEDMCRSSLAEAHHLLSDYVEGECRVKAELVQAFAAGKEAIAEYIVDTLNETETIIVFFNFETVENLVGETPIQLRDLVQKIERRGSEACLEELSWELPEEDLEQCEVFTSLSS